VAGGGAPPPQQTAMALWAGGEATRLPGFAWPLGRGEDLRVAGSVARPEQGLRAFARDGGDDDLRRDESAYAAAIGACGVRIIYRADARDSPFTKLPLRACFVRVTGEVCSEGPENTRKWRNAPSAGYRSVEVPAGGSLYHEERAR
jgi:hypothetical protein